MALDDFDELMSIHKAYNLYCIHFAKALLKFYKTDSVHKILVGYGQQDICSVVFRLKYIERKSAEDVAEELYIDRRTVFKQLDHEMLDFAYWMADNVYFPVVNKFLPLKELFWVGGSYVKDAVETREPTTS